MTEKLRIYIYKDRGNGICKFISCVLIYRQRVFSVFFKFGIGFDCVKAGWVVLLGLLKCCLSSISPEKYASFITSKYIPKLSLYLP